MKPTEFNKKHAHGFMLIELAIVLTIIGIGTVWYTDFLSRQNDDSLKSLVAGQLMDIEKAGINYTATYAAQIRAGTAITGVASAVAPTITELAALNVGLPSTFTATGALNTGYSVNVSILTPSNDLQTIVRTTTPITNNTGVADSQWASVVATKIGAKAAHSTATTPATLTGMGGTWTIPNPAGSVAGIVAIRDTLSANLTGSQFWKDPVANFADLPTTGNNTGDARMVTSLGHIFTWNGASWLGTSIDQNGNLSVLGNLNVAGTTTSPTFSVGGSTITASTGTYGALTVTGNKNGWGGINFQITPGVSAGTLMQSSTYSGILSPGDTGWAQLTQYNAGAAGTANGLTYMGTANVPQVVATNAQINGTATVGAGCTSNGLVAQDGTGLLLSCQSGSWQKAQGSIGSFYQSGNGGFRYTTAGSIYSSGICSTPTACVTANSKTGTCSCPAGTTPIVISRVTGDICAGTKPTDITYTCQ